MLRRGCRFPGEMSSGEVRGGWFYGGHKGGIDYVMDTLVMLKVTGTFLIN